MMDLGNVFTYAYSAGTDADLAQAVTAAAASTNYIDLDVAGLDIVGSKGPYLIVKVGADDFETTVSIAIRLQTDTDSAFGTALKDVAQWRFTLAQMTAGALLINQMLPKGLYQRYLRLYFTPFTDATAGSFIAYLSDAPEPAVAQVDQTEPAS